MLERLTYDFDILMLQETKSDRVSFQGYTAYNNPCSATHHEQTILIKEGIDHVCLDMEKWNREDREVQAISLAIRGKEWTIINVYIGNNSASTPTDWEFLNELAELGEHVLVAGDFNAKSSTWGNMGENAQGQALDAFLVENNLTLINTSAMTRLAQRDGEEDSNIDLAVIKMRDADQQKWQDLHSYGSEHLPCVVMIKKEGKDVKRKDRQPKPFQYSRSKETVLDRIRTAAWVPKSKKPDINQPAYWNEELDDLWLQKRKATRAWQIARKATPNLAETIQEKKNLMTTATQKFKETAASLKHEKWLSFAKEVSTEKALSGFWNLHKRMNKRNSETTSKNIKDDDDNILKTDEEKGQAFLARYIQQTHQGNLEKRKEIKDIINLAVPEETSEDLITYNY
ncbi:hypothetical protein EGW08_005925 [Elysia chlorotica]|uniref:Endonuclease/exonuclease/phosphatase domain-containing protein n=1 Tax=Elysia chlorotica TaxID=188477 RepID=A0A3S0ZYQ8_ELYCH|nr:hypothetical protein EGW08_005925 [Elysia chlorotica]